MAAPTYDTDLSSANGGEITDAETTTGWAAYGGGGAGLDNNADIAMQGSFCVAKQITNADKGVYFTGSASLAAGDHIFAWLFCGTPGLTDTKQNKGASILVGSGSNAYCQYHVEGNDTYGASGRVAKCYAVDYSVRNTNASAPYRTATGNPGASPTVFGGGLVTTASVKGFNLGVDAIRFGTGAYLTGGELISEGDASDNPATFAGFQAYNDGISNRFGLLTRVGGGYELQGRFAIGQNASKTATRCVFKDSDRSIAIVDTEHAASTFNQIVVDQASTYCEWTNISFTALGTTAPGNIAINAGTFNATGGTWTGLGTIGLSSGSTIDGTTFRQTGVVTQNGASISSATFDRCATVVSDTPASFTNNAFVGDGTTTPGHAIDFGTISGGTSGSPITINWSNSLDNGANASVWEGSTQGQTAGTQGTANDAIVVNVTAGSFCKIAVGAGATIPTVQNTGTGTLEITANEVTLTITVVDIDTGSPIEGAMVYVTTDAGATTIINKVETNAAGQVSDTRSLGSAKTLSGRVRAATPASKPYTKFYKTSPVAGTYSNVSDTNITIQMIPDE